MYENGKKVTNINQMLTFPSFCYKKRKSSCQKNKIFPKMSNFPKIFSKMYTQDLRKCMRLNEN
jgi:hypothetical protein